jgi:hypothetical protein
VSVKLDSKRFMAIISLTLVTGVHMPRRLLHRGFILFALIVLQAQVSVAAVHGLNQTSASDQSFQTHAPQEHVTREHCHQAPSEEELQAVPQECCDSACTMMACHFSSAALNTLVNSISTPRRGIKLGYSPSAAPLLAPSSLYRPPIFA